MCRRHLANKGTDIAGYCNESEADEKPLERSDCRTWTRATSLQVARYGKFKSPLPGRKETAPVDTLEVPEVLAHLAPRSSSGILPPHTPRPTFSMAPGSWPESFR